MSRTTGPLVTTYAASPPVDRADFAAFRTRVQAEQGGIANAEKCQAALSLLAGLPRVVQWLDARWGVRTGQATTRWFSICGPQADMAGGVYGTPLLGVDSELGGQVWSGGAWLGNAGPLTTPTLSLEADYSWGMHLYLKPNASGVLWGDFHDARGSQYDNAWTYMLIDFWRSYDGVDDAISFSLPRGEWFWLWVLKQGNQLRILVGEQEVARLTLTHPIYEKSMGLAGASDSFGVTNSDVRYPTFLRAASLLSEAQRAAFMAI